MEMTEENVLITISLGGKKVIDAVVDVESNFLVHRSSFVDHARACNDIIVAYLKSYRRRKKKREKKTKKKRTRDSIEREYGSTNNNG